MPRIIHKIQLSGINSYLSLVVIYGRPIPEAELGPHRHSIAWLDRPNHILYGNLLLLWRDRWHWHLHGHRGRPHPTDPTHAHAADPTPLRNIRLHSTHFANRREVMGLVVLVVDYLGDGGRWLVELALDHLPGVDLTRKHLGLDHLAGKQTAGLWGTQDMGLVDRARAWGLRMDCSGPCKDLLLHDHLRLLGLGHLDDGCGGGRCVGFVYRLLHCNPIRSILPIWLKHLFNHSPHIGPVPLRKSG